MQISMNNIYVPTDSSNLIKFIPPNEEILYSTLCNITYKKSPGDKYPVTYISHLLLTENGLAYFCRPYGNLLDKEEPTEQLPTYNTPLNIKSISTASFDILHIDIWTQSPVIYRIKIISDPKIEIENEFNKRQKEFYKIIYPLIINNLEVMITFIQENKNKQLKENSPLWRVNKSILKSSYDQPMSKLTHSAQDIQEVELDMNNEQTKRVKNIYKKEYLKLLNEVLELHIFKLGNIGYLKSRINNEGKVISLLKLRNLPNPPNQKHSSLFFQSYENNLVGRLRTIKKTVEKQEKKLNKRLLKQNKNH